MKFNYLKSIVKRKEFSNSAWNIADTLAIPFLMLLFTPFFIKKLGPGEYGIWMFVNSVIASIGIFNVGLGDAAIKFVSKYNALLDNLSTKRTINTLFSLSLAFFILYVIIGFGISASLSFLINRFGLFDISSFDYKILTISIQLGGIIFGFKQIEQVILSIFKGYERFDTSSKISITSKLFLLVTQAIVVYFGYHLIVIFFFSAIITFISVLLEILFVRIKIKGISFKPSFKIVSLKEIFTFSSWAWVQSVLSVISSHIDKFVVFTFAGPKFFAYYSLASLVGGQIHGIFVAGSGWLFPNVSGKRERNENIAGLYHKMQLIVLVFGFGVISILIVFNKVIFETWLGTETYLNSILLIKIFLYLAFFNMLSIVPYFFLLGSNLIRISATIMLTSLLSTIVFMILSYQYFNVDGLAYGKLFSALISIPIMLIFVHFRILDKSNRSSACIIYLAALFLSASIYFLNIYSILLLVIGMFFLNYLYKGKIDKSKL